MKGDKKKRTPPRSADKNTADSARELNDSDLEGVAGGIAWHGKPDEQKPGAGWDKWEEW